MRNIKLTLQYDGSAFHGWQFQPNCITVEEELKKSLRQIIGEEVKLYSCSRTDTGVHANMFCCNFKTENSRECDKLMLGLNAVLPATVSVIDCCEMPLDFHSRYDCKGKEYIYKIWNSKQRNPFLRDRALHYPWCLDDEMLDSQAKDFIGTYDFSAFCASGATVKTTVRTVIDCCEMPLDFHSRYDCKGKEYIYKIWNSKQRNPFLRDRALHYPWYLDDEMLDSQAKDFIGTYDFSAFCASGATVKTTVRTVFDCSVKRDGDLVVFSVKGDGFLYNMVRIMVGTLLDINEGKIEKNTIKDIIESCRRENAGVTAKAEGLYLNRVYYEDGEICD